MDKQQILAGLCIASLVLQLGAIATPYWSVKSKKENTAKMGNVTLDVHMGLWKACLEGMNNNNAINVCTHLPPSTDMASSFPNFPKNSLHACQALAIIGAILTALALFSFLYMKMSKKLQLAYLTLGAVCSLVACIVWMAELYKVNGPQNVTLKLKGGYSIGLELLGGIIALICAGYYGWYVKKNV